MRVSSRKVFEFIVVARTAPDCSDFFHPKETKYSVVTIRTVRSCKETEEKKCVTDANTLFC